MDTSRVENEIMNYKKAFIDNEMTSMVELKEEFQVLGEQQRKSFNSTLSKAKSQDMELILKEQEFTDQVLQKLYQIREKLHHNVMSITGQFQQDYNEMQVWFQNYLISVETNEKMVRKQTHQLMLELAQEKAQMVKQLKAASK
ncbi:hypothetical protein MP228_001590 [Amoeboaphelidium protococcarum]|nr:hypothetical protein MP228_001590 [Amoeboaphelidium protococcarum]